MNAVQPYRPTAYPTYPPYSYAAHSAYPALPAAGSVYANPAYPGSLMPEMAPPVDPASLVAQLGLGAKLGVDGSVQYNLPLVQQVVSLREKALPALNLLLNSTSSTATIMEALHAATLMAENGVQGVEKLYPAAARFNHHIDPAVQVHLARFYGKINEPKAFGPLLTTAIHYAANQYPAGSYAASQFTEEAGKSFLNQLARLTAQETVRQLLPFLRPTTQPYATQTGTSVLPATGRIV